jgi:4-hydroxybenzoate polyprenyltransferase
MNPQLYPTLRLLNSSTVVAITGGFRLYIAFILAGIAIRIPECGAFALIMYATYELDRALDCKEDAINKSELCGADRKIGLIACIVTFLAGAFLLGLDGIYLAPFLPFIIGYFYSHGLRIGSFTVKLKGSLGVKNLIVGLTWGGTIALIVSRWCDNIVTVGIILLFFGSKTFITSCVNDFKDVRGDLAAGLKTLPASLGEDLTRRVLIMINLGMHGIMVYALVTHIIWNDWIIVLYSLVIPTLFLLVYSSSFENSPIVIIKRLREIVVYWESAITLVVRLCVAD